MKTEQIRNVDSCGPGAGRRHVCFELDHFWGVLGWRRSFMLESLWEGILARSVVFASRIFLRAHVYMFVLCE